MSGTFFIMTAKTFNIKNYITVPGFAIVELGLSGNELLCYSLIYGFTQDNETEFTGSLSYVASALNVTRQNAKKIIDRLIERGLVEKKENNISGVKFCRYITNSNTVAETATGCYQNSNGGVAETVTHNINKYISKDITNIPAEGGLFEDVPEITPVVKGKRRTSETSACLFDNSRYSDYDTFAAEFRVPEFANIDIAYYYHAVRDWSAQHGRKMKDWIATARNFIRGDIERNKLHTLKTNASILTQEEIDYLKEMS